MTDVKTQTSEAGICITCGRRGGLCRWTDDAEVCMRKQLDEMRTEIERLHGVLLSVCAQSSGRRAIEIAHEALQTIRSPVVDHWLGRDVQNAE